MFQAALLFLDYSFSGHLFINKVASIFIGFTAGDLLPHRFHRYPLYDYRFNRLLCT